MFASLALQIDIDQLKDSFSLSLSFFLEIFEGTEEQNINVFVNLKVVIIKFIREKGSSNKL